MAAQAFSAWLKWIARATLKMNGGEGFRKKVYQL